mmetsp:Transcript_58050/g.170392  ORF Transcript_58050/g.170392 Transcript_58050/m.170392 type:complete len:100 (+) Transcript_58050:81-380(+)
MPVAPLVGYFVAQQLIKPGGVLDGVLPKPIVGWFPVLLAILSHVIWSQWQSREADKANAALVGEDAPDLELKFRERTITLQALVKEKSLPTVVDFYQNF